MHLGGVRCHAILRISKHKHLGRVNISEEQEHMLRSKRSLFYPLLPGLENAILVLSEVLRVCFSGLVSQAL